MNLALDLGPHAIFIVSAYIVAALIVALMIGGVALDHRRQVRALAELEGRGITRRSQPRPEKRPGEATT